jgi:hypothetical protein
MWQKVCRKNASSSEYEKNVVKYALMPTIESYKKQMRLSLPGHRSAATTNHHGVEKANIFPVQSMNRYTSSNPIEISIQNTIYFQVF